MLLIGITGMPGAGKSAIFKVAEMLNIPIIAMGDVVREETIKEGLKLTPENVGKTAIKLREKYGNEAVAVVCLEKINKEFKNRDIVIVEGIRSLYELNYFRKNYPLVLIGIHSSPLTRYNRIKERKREDDSSDWNIFIERDLRELNFGIGNVIALSDFMVINEDSYDNLVNNLKNIVENIIKNKDKFKEHKFIYR